MKHEALVNAISEIDEQLLAEARSIRPARRMNTALTWCAAAAACLAVAFCAAAILGAGGSTEVLVHGQEISAAGYICAEQQNNNDEFVPRMASTLMQIPVEISSQGKTDITVSSGELCVVSADGERLFVGGEYTVSSAAVLLWSVSADDTAAQYRMTITGRKTSSTIVLSYEEELGWILVSE